MRRGAFQRGTEAHSCQAARRTPAAGTRRQPPRGETVTAAAAAHCRPRDSSTVAAAHHLPGANGTLAAGPLGAGRGVLNAQDEVIITEAVELLDSAVGVVPAAAEGRSMSA